MVAAANVTGAAISMLPSEVEMEVGAACVVVAISFAVVVGSLFVVDALLVRVDRLRL